MDYLNPRKQFRQRLILLIGYVCIAVGILIGTILLLEQANGVSRGKDGSVILNGLVFFSSQPGSAKIYINGKQNSASTNARLLIPEGIYHVKLNHPGYRSWQRTIEVNGDAVEHFDYPFLFPTTLTTKKLATSYASAPALMTQSPDRRWLIVQEPAVADTFDLYDLKNPTKAPTDITLPAGVASPATSSESWQLEEWADDNQHLVLQHTYDGKTEFILVDRANPTQSTNLDTTLGSTPAKLTLLNKKYDQYYLYDPATELLQTASTKTPAGTPVLDHVLAYQSYGSNTLLYATDSGAPTGKVLVKLSVGSQTYTIRELPISTTYLLDLTKYGDTLYVAVTASNDTEAYVYKDPVGQLNAQHVRTPIPAQVLHVTNPNYLSFSNNAQFIVVEDGQQFGVYDVENQLGYSYSAPQPLDAPQSHASWMDGDRLTYVSHGKLQVFDYDNTNQQTLTPASSNYLPVFAPAYDFVYALAANPTSPGQFNLTQTPLLLP